MTDTLPTPVSTQAVSIQQASMLTSSLLDSLADSIDDVSTAATLPAELYTAAEFLEFETEALFMKEWLCVGRAENHRGWRLVHRRPGR